MISRRQFLIALPLSASLPALARAAAGTSNPVGCQANAFQIKPGDFADLLKRLGDMKRLGFGHFECNLRFVEGQFANAKEARKQIQETGMTFFGPHTGMGQAADYLDRSIDGAASLGATRLAVSGAGKALTADGRLDEKALKKKVETLTRIAKSCRKAGLRMTYHNHGAEFAANGAEMTALIEQTDPELVFFLTDLGHAHRAKADVVAFFTRNHARIDAMHLRDIRGKEQVPLGQGELDYTALAAEVRKTNWPGWLTVEEENLSKTHDAQSVESILETDRRAIRKFFEV